ncbi:hypothetical protein MmiHf6_13210 [Methanimicrococcus hongohii]|uniref:Uncharacterized protein n=1 Tax=Methanimicrococcus hongohii TaxID=3028295 RepID=A0AA96V0A9_9EURY|nr:hypothetical protein [Methanimicrococcus sp. Hf6]WNY23996.1 hypothetical protein MmiHf6_13210 [Methanimicrococcus sp. Hf6]
MADSFPYETRNQKQFSFLAVFGACQACKSVTVFSCCQLPAEPARLQLSLNVAAARRSLLPRASAHFNHNPFASRTCRRDLTVSVAAAVAVCTAARRARTASFFIKYLKFVPQFYFIFQQNRDHAFDFRIEAANIKKINSLKKCVKREKRLTTKR